MKSGALRLNTSVTEYSSLVPKHNLASKPKPSTRASECLVSSIQALPSIQELPWKLVRILVFESYQNVCHRPHKFYPKPGCSSYENLFVCACLLINFVHVWVCFNCSCSVPFPLLLPISSPIIYCWLNLKFRNGAKQCIRDILNLARFKFEKNQIQNSI